MVTFVEQPLGFQDFQFSNHVFKLQKFLYRLKQIPKSWYVRLSLLLTKGNFNKGKVDSTLFIKKSGNDILFVQIYVDDIMFGSNNLLLCKDFSKIMQISIMRELNFFLEMQIK